MMCNWYTIDRDDDPDDLSVLMAVQIYYQFTSACDALAILQVLNQRIKS
jgi:hypothetical protein